MIAKVRNAEILRVAHVSSVSIRLNYPFRYKDISAFRDFCDTVKKSIKEKCIGDALRIGSIIFHPSKLWKAKFSILCDVIFLVRLQGEI